ncbi:CTD kinase subunit alpha [Cytospora mali]|uniref:cyclin-dependent kinase n=1 Tax=Cytospora mali TaxID=578113 RepID=A0A194VGF4_CYTMA|nr:CTD kinase subunit alpha [Valsa mali var. pyri (nom. inval.)]
MHFVPAKRRRFSASTSLLHPPHPPQHRHNGAMPYDSRPPGDDRKTVTDTIASLNLDDAPAALNGLRIQLNPILADSEILAEIVLVALTIYFNDIANQALEADLGTARLHAQLSPTTRLLTTPGALPSKTLADRLCTHDLHQPFNDREVPTLLHSSRNPGGFGRSIVHGELTGSQTLPDPTPPRSGQRIHLIGESDPRRGLNDARSRKPANRKHRLTAPAVARLHAVNEIFRTIPISVHWARELLHAAIRVLRLSLAIVALLPVLVLGALCFKAAGAHRKGPAEPASGPNSIEVNMSARGNFRGAYGGQYPMRGHYNQGPHSSGHATPNSSFHGTPPAQSPYGGSRGSWGGQQQYSPQNQFPPQYPQNGYAPTAPAAHFQGSQANSPPIGTPTGPSNQFSQSSYRGGYRSSSSGGYRGNGLGAGRGGNRGGFKSGHWGSSGSGSRAASSQPDDSGSGRATPRAGSVAGDQASVHSDSVTQEAENPFRPPKELQVEDTVREENNETQPMPPPTGRLPPTGPAAEKKISFALKSAPKAPVATPKLEISSKFNAPAKKDPPKEPSRDRHDPRDARESRDAKSSRDPRDHRDHREHREHRERTPPKHAADGRDLPRNVPTEPRAAKMAGEQRQRQEQQKPREPRVRMVKKKMKRLKEKPSLTDGLAGSDSVYFRKPGNESVIGAGTYGKVFKALHVYTKKLVALKRIRMEGERDGFPVTAVREIKLLQSLRHINIVALLEVMVEKNECYMVFEYMSHDLTGILNHPTFKLDAAHRKHLSKQLFEGLDYLHQRGVLHRDIKAANILVSADGILKLADFGLARFYAKRHQLDYTNRVITIWYRSPELLLGETQYSPAVDIWSAACVMVEIFTRRAIFPGDGGEISQLDKIYSVLGTPHRSEWSGLVDMPWFELLRPGVRKPNVFAEQYEERLPPAAFKLLAEMLQYDPAKRPTAAQVLEHPYFTTESPPPRQAVELQQIDGDWHEFESKALRRENERKEREARKAAEKSGSGSSTRDGKDSRKRPPEANDANRENKRQHVEKPPRVPEAMDVTPAEAISSQKA